MEDKNGKEVPVAGQKRGIRPLIDCTQLRSLCKVHPFSDGSNTVQTLQNVLLFRL